MSLLSASSLMLACPAARRCEVALSTTAGLTGFVVVSSRLNDSPTLPPLVPPFR
jgi:hypothetical protein